MELARPIASAQRPKGRPDPPGQIAINLILERLPNLRLAVPAEKLRWRATPVVRGLSALPLRFGA
jgi:hypothetical protein